MPIALPKDGEAAWLDAGMTDAAAAIGFAREFAVTEFVHHPVNPRVNRPEATSIAPPASGGSIREITEDDCSQEAKSQDSSTRLRSRLEGD